MPYPPSDVIDRVAAAAQKAGLVFHAGT